MVSGAQQHRLGRRIKDPNTRTIRSPARESVGVRAGRTGSAFCWRSLHTGKGIHLWLPLSKDMMINAESEDKKARLSLISHRASQTDHSTASETKQTTEAG